MYGNINSIQATILRFEALQDTIQVSAAKGQKSHTWLSQREVKRLLSQPDPRKPIGRRDKIALGLCGCWLTQGRSNDGSIC